MLYDIGFGLFSIFYLPTLICKGKLHADFGERFGSFSAEKRARLAAARDVIWIQAVSVGEVALCQTLVPLVREAFPGSTVVISTITKTGNDLAVKLFGRDAIIIYFPLDFSAVVRKVVGMIRPMAYIMIETELWPNVLAELARRRVCAVLLNGRISDRSAASYMRVRRFLTKSLRSVAAFCMQSKADAERIIAMGAPRDRVEVTGTMKFDLVAPASARPAREIEAQLGLSSGAKLIVAGSTHPGEEEALLDAYLRLRDGRDDLRLLIAPRHVDRVADIERTVRGRGLEPVRVSGLGQARAADGGRVLIVDKIGILGDIYAAATVVFVGGSLVRHGGQNPIEPALYGKPVIFGPHMFNFKAVAAALLEKGGAVRVDDEGALERECARLLDDPAARRSLGENAAGAIAANRGASLRNLDAVRRAVAEGPVP